MYRSYDELRRPPVYFSVPENFTMGQNFILPKNFTSFPVGQSFPVRVISSATGQAIWWPLQLFFILFMNMTVLYIL